MDSSEETADQDVSSEETADPNFSSKELQERASPYSNITQSPEIHDSKIHSSKPGEETNIPSAVAIEKVKDPDVTVCALQSGQERSTHTIVRLDTPSLELHRLQSGHDSPSMIREKVSKDGYNWRKYGQKFVKGNQFIRSYYRCTHPNCQAKKQLEQSNCFEQITDSICIGQHNHPRPQSNITQSVESVVLPVVGERPDKPSSANVEDKAPAEHGCVPQQIKPTSLKVSNASPTNEVKASHLKLTRANDEVHDNEESDSKRLKRDNSSFDATGVDLSSCESRVVVRTSSEVDLVNDGYRWRKYGQKLVKGNANPRSYYRCSTPGCPVKKHVERASHDSKIVITTYEGQHDHDIPPGRTVTHNTAANAHTITTANGKPKAESKGNTVHVDTKRESGSLNSESRSNEQLNGNSITKPEAGVISLNSEVHESKVNRKEQPNERSRSKEDPCRSNEQQKVEVETKSEGSKECGILDACGPPSELKEQSKSDAEAVQS